MLTPGRKRTADQLLREPDLVLVLRLCFGSAIVCGYSDYIGRLSGPDLLIGVGIVREGVKYRGAQSTALRQSFFFLLNLSCLGSVYEGSDGSESCASEVSPVRTKAHELPGRGIGSGQIAWGRWKETVHLLALAPMIAALVRNGDASGTVQSLRAVDRRRNTIFCKLPVFANPQAGGCGPTPRAPITSRVRKRNRSDYAA